MPDRNLYKLIYQRTNIFLRIFIDKLLIIDNDYDKIWLLSNVKSSVVFSIRVEPARDGENKFSRIKRIQICFTSSGTSPTLNVSL